MRRKGMMQGQYRINVGGTGRRKKPKARRETCAGAHSAGNKAIGAIGEKAALEYLLQAGYKLIERNWQCRHREIDLIMKGSDGIHIVEVKTRTEPVLARPEQAVDRHKRSNMECAAGTYLKKTGICTDIHFDIVSIVLDSAMQICRIDFIQDAFYPIRGEKHMTVI